MGMRRRSGRGIGFIRMATPCCSKRRSAPPPLLAPHPEEALSEAAFGLESLGLGLDLAVQQVTANAEQREGRVGHQGGRGAVHGLTRTSTDWHGRGLSV